MPTTQAVRTRGRPRALDSPEVQATILQAIEVGMFLAQSARFAGIGESTLHSWRNRWRSSDPEAVEHFDAFFRALEREEARSEIRALKIIHQGSPGWLASAWWLRNYPRTTGTDFA
jgi:transposase-like protein